MSAAKLAVKVGRVDGADSQSPVTTLRLIARFARAQRSGTRTALRRWLHELTNWPHGRHPNCTTCGTRRPVIVFDYRKGGAR